MRQTIDRQFNSLSSSHFYFYFPCIPDGVNSQLRNKLCGQIRDSTFQVCMCLMTFCIINRKILSTDMTAHKKRRRGVGSEIFMLLGENYNFRY